MREGSMSAMSPIFMPSSISVFRSTSAKVSYGSFTRRPDICTVRGVGEVTVKNGRHPLADDVHERAGETESGILGEFLPCAFERTRVISAIISSSFAEFFGLFCPVHETSDVSHVPVHLWLYDTLEHLFVRAAAEHDRHFYPPEQHRHLVFDAGLKVPEQVHRDIVLVDDVALLVVQAGDPLPGPRAIPIMLLLAPSQGRWSSAISQDGCGRWWISRLMLTTAISVPTSGESVTSPASGFPIARISSTSSFGTKHWSTTSCAIICFWTMSPPEILDEVDDLVVPVNPTPVRNRDKDHGASPMSANFSRTSASPVSVRVSSLATNENFSAP